MPLCTVQSRGQLQRFGKNCLQAPLSEPPTSTPPCPSHADVHTSNTHTLTLTHLTPSHPIILWQSPLCPCGPPTQQGPCQGKLEKRGGGGGFCFEALCEKKKNPNHFLSWSNLTCCDNCSVRNFFDISEREDFLPQNQSSI